jgi:hypothetical protein
MPPPAKSLAKPPPTVVTAPAATATARSDKARERASAPGTAEAVHAQFMIGNAAVAAAMVGAPPGAVPPFPGAPPPLPTAPRTRGPASPLPAVPLPAPTLPGTALPAPAAPAPAAPSVPAAPAPAAPSVPAAPAPAEPAPAESAPGRAPVERSGVEGRAGPGAGKAPPVPPAEADRRASGDKVEQDKDRPEKKKPAEQEAAAKRSPGADPKFQALKADVGKKKKAVASSHRPAGVEAGAAQAAAVAPADDREARGKAAHAEEMNEAQPKEFDKAGFIRAVEEAIERRSPKNLEEADEFGDSGKAEEVKAEVQGEVGEGKKESAQEIATTTARVPQPAPDAKQVVPMSGDKPPGAPAAPDPANAVPDRLPPSATDMSAGPAQVEGQMAAAKVTEEQLARSNEPGFTNALGDKRRLEAHSAAAPPALRAGEAATLKAGTAHARRLGGGAMGEMAGTRADTGRRVDSGKGAAKGRDEKKRAEVTALLQKVFDATKTDVEKILSDLDGEVDRRFTDGEKRAREQFTSEHETKMRRYKDERYSGWDGKARWLHDKIFDLPAEVNRFYEEAKRNYLTRMRLVISDVADAVEASLRAAKDRIATGRKQLKAAVDKLPADLRGIGQQAAQEFADKFAELADTVNDKGVELVDTLATRYVDAVKSVDEEIAAEKEKNRGAVAKAKDAIGGVIKAIKELGALLLGVLRKAVAAIGAILKDPIGFLRNLVSAVGAGLKLFMKNIGRHLQTGILGWLLGTSAQGGIRLPARFDTRGLVLLIAQMLGLSWANIRARLVRKAPQRAVAEAERAVPIVSRAKRQGVAGLWDDMKSQVGDLKKELIGKVIAYVTPTIILAGITWILSLLNPASAFIRACKLIIDIIRFIVTQARQIIDFVNAVLDAVIAIAKGGGGGVPALIERALARSIPVLIGALAALLGIGGVAGKVKQIFQTLQRPVNRALDKVIDTMAALTKKLSAKLKTALDRKKKPKPKHPTPRTRPTRKVPTPKKRAPRKPTPRTRPTDKRPPRDKARDAAAQQRALQAALREARALVPTATSVADLRAGLPAIRRRHRLTALELVIDRIEAGVHVLHFVAAINPAKQSPPERALLNRDVVQAEYGILIRNQERFQAIADAKNLIIDVRPTNPHSVRLLLEGAIYKPEGVKPKTINKGDVLLGVATEHLGAVGFFMPGLLLESEILRADFARARDRRKHRIKEQREYGPAMRKLRDRPEGPGKFDWKGTVEDPVVYGYDERGRRQIVAGDHDMFSIRHADGTELSDTEYNQLVTDMKAGKFGVQHGAVVQWRPANDKERKMRDGLLKQHQRGGEGLVRFAPHSEMRFVFAETRI